MDKKPFEEWTVEEIVESLSQARLCIERLDTLKEMTEADIKRMELRIQELTTKEISNV